jgi:hypothetical protein
LKRVMSVPPDSDGRLVPVMVKFLVFGGRRGGIEKQRRH